MKGKRYDMKKLAASGMIDITVSQRFYYNNQEYFDTLTKFLDYHTGLGNYTPAFVVNSEEDCASFMLECFEARAEFMRLGLTVLLQELAVMEDAVINKDMKEFADGQTMFMASLTIYKDLIKDAAMRWKVGT